jgi:hypothetical protein
LNDYVVLNSANFNDYAPNKAGLGAFGTWGINVSGTSGSVAYRGNVSAEGNGTAEPSGQLTLRGVYANGYPTSYGNLITLGGGGGGELLIGWSGSTGSHADNYVRSRRDTGNTWSPWAKILTDANYTSVFHPVATSGDYNALNNKPSIPTPVNIPSMNAALQNIVKTIVGTIDLYMTASSGSGYTAGYVGAAVGAGWSSYTAGNRTGVTAYLGNRGGSITLVVDVAAFIGCSNNPADLNWRGNYDFNVAPSLTRVLDQRIQYYGMGANQWAVECYKVTDSRTSSNYGRFSITVTLSGDHYYHGTNLQAGWIGIGSRTNNVYNP